MQLVLTLALLVSFGTGCSLVVSFDRDRIMDGSASVDGGVPEDGGGMDGAVPDGGSDAGPACGNGASDTGEACDDANTSAGDGCSATCTVETGFECDGFGADSCTAICGDSMMLGDEACDDGFETACGDCNADCTGAGTAIACGDGMICTDSEACDDMNTADDDGCAAGCDAIETGWVCAGEPSVCEETCNNGVLDMGETCDDGANVPGDGCSASCQMEAGWSCTGMPSVCAAVCGDGMVIAGEEECDDMDTMSGDGCSMTCDEETGWTCAGAPSVCDEDCGDGMTVGAEACDDMNLVTEAACPYGMATCMGCNADCTMELSLTGNVCGDGVISAGDEMCDDMDTAADDGCSATCTVETGWTCMGAVLSTCTPICGDNRVRGAEACDDNNTVTETACPYGTAMCTACNATCSMVLNLTGNVCGDGVRSVGDETCDDGNTDNCGTCAADCGTSQSPRAATGEITVTTNTAATPDGGTVRIGDGVRFVTFEINKTGGVSGSNVEVNISAATDAADIALLLATAINSSALEIDATRTSAVITLTNAVGGIANGNGGMGNQAITQGGGLTWTLNGMAGGRARNCLSPTGCASNNDCASQMCSGGMCAP